MARRTSTEKLVEDKTIPEVLRGLDTGRRSRGRRCESTFLSGRSSSRRKRFGGRAQFQAPSSRTVEYDRYSFHVNCSEGTNRPHRVRITFADPDKPLREKRLFVRCSCEDFIFGGAQWHAKTENYLSGVLRAGSVFSPPDIRDPERDNKVCKHVVTAVHEVVRNPDINIDEDIKNTMKILQGANILELINTL